MRRSILIAAFALATGALASETARAGDFMASRLSFSLTDENLLVKPGETTPSIPGLRFGAPIPRWGTMFFDNYDTRFSGFENLTNLVVYKAMHDGQSDFDAALALRYNEASDVLASLYDAGSYLKWTYWFDPTRTSKTNLAVTAFPMSSDPMRLGYSYKISWGGSPFFSKPNPDNPYASAGASQNTTAVPGLRIQLSGDKAYGFLGMKTTLLLNKADNQQEAVQSVLGGAGVDLTDELRVEANGGFFDRGANPKQDVLGAPVQTFGGTGQIVYHHGIPVGRSADFALYKNDPTSLKNLFQPEEYPGGLSWLVSSEATWTGTTLEDPEKSGTTTIAPGIAGDVNFRLKLDKLRVHADLMYRNLMFVLINVPSFVPFQAISATSATTTPEMFAAAGADYFFAGPQLTLGFTGGVQNPATFSGTLPKATIGNIPNEALPLSTTVVVRSEGDFDLLPENAAVMPIIAAKASAKLQRGMFDVVGEINFAFDNNVTQLQRGSSEGSYSRVFITPYLLGFNLAFQAKF